MSQSKLRLLIVVGVVALAGLFATQAFWFNEAFNAESDDFERNVNLALRAVADEALKAQGDSISTIPPVEQRSASTFAVRLSQGGFYSQTVSDLEKQIEATKLPENFTFALEDCLSREIVLGSSSESLQDDGQPACADREQEMKCYNLVVTFPGKEGWIIARMGVWVFSSVAFLIVLFFFVGFVYRANQQKKLDQLKSDFINNMTHELNTPITNIALASEVMKTSMQSDEAVNTDRFLEIIRNENAKLKGHVDHILMAAAMQKKDFELEMEPVQVRDMVNNIVSEFALRVNQLGGSLKAVHNATKTLVSADKKHLRHSLQNLVDNAIKYSKNTVDIQVATEDTDEGILISVIDRGIGITREALQEVFSPFYRVQQGNLHEAKGFGIGLSYVKGVVEAHNGRIEVDSAPTQGSTFTIFLPSS